MYRIAIVEDDLQLCELVAEMLQKYGFEVKYNFNFRKLPEELITIQPHLILLDINLPYYDGYHIARELRKECLIPIIMISARGSESEQIRGFDLGADDFVIKPFSMDILIAKINACLRRSYQTPMPEPERVNIGNFSIHKNNFSMSYKGSNVELTKNELKIILALVEHHRDLVKRDYLLQELWDDMTFVEDNTLNVNMSRVKSKLELLGLKDVIHTKRGEGYLLSLEGEEDEIS